MPSGYPYLLGRSYMEATWLIVPRAVWPTKPRSVLVELQSQYLDPRSGAAFPAYGELFANFGWTGAIVGSMAFGYGVERLWNALRGSTTAHEALLSAGALAVVVYLYFAGYLAGALASQFGIIFGLGVGYRLLRTATRPNLGPSGMNLLDKSRSGTRPLRWLRGEYATTVGTNLVVALLGFAVAIALARWFGPTGRGELPKAMIVPGMISTLGALGIPAATAYFTAQYRLSSGDILAKAVCLSIILGLGMTVIALSLVRLLFSRRDRAFSALAIATHLSSHRPFPRK